MRRAIAIAFTGMVLLSLGFQQGIGSPSKMPSAKSSFTDVEAIFKTSCMPCHSGPKPAGHYDLTSHANVMKNGEDGPMVVPGKPDKSPLIAYLKGTKKPLMPFKARPLSAAKIKTISDWIKKGAKNK